MKNDVAPEGSLLLGDVDVETARRVLGRLRAGSLADPGAGTPWEEHVARAASLLQISAERLATLPPGVLIEGWGRMNATGMDVLTTIAAVLPLSLNLTDTLTAAVVAVKIVRPWLEEQGSRSGREFGDAEALAQHHWLLSAAMLMQPLTPKQIDTLARLARAAMEEG